MRSRTWNLHCSLSYFFFYKVLLCILIYTFVAKLSSGIIWGKHFCLTQTSAESMVYSTPSCSQRCTVHHHIFTYPVCQSCESAIVEFNLERVLLRGPTQLHSAQSQFCTKTSISYLAPWYTADSSFYSALERTQLKCTLVLHVKTHAHSSTQFIHMVREGMLGWFVQIWKLGQV